LDNNAKQPVAYCGIDPSVRQAGNFTGTKNKFTKRMSQQPIVVYSASGEEMKQVLKKSLCTI